MKGETEMGASRVLERVRAGIMTLARASVSRIDSEGRVFVAAPNEDGAEVACDVLEDSAGRDPAISAGQAVLVAWATGSSLRPVVLGPIADRLTPAPQHGEARPTAQAAGPTRPGGDSVERIEGKRIHVSASEELVLECGPAEIRITADGKIVIRGEHVLSRARGTHRIKGGSVAIN
jgi:hypothetical protein